MLTVIGVPADAVNVAPRRDHEHPRQFLPPQGQTQSRAGQAQQIQNLTIPIEKTLGEAAQEPEERLVVRERIATVRSKPEHGAAVEGKLMPNEMVRKIDKDCK